MQKIVNYLRGTVTVEAQGPFLERYFNICANAGIGFWNVRQLGEDRVRFTLARWDRNRVLALGEKALCRAEVVGEAGLLSFLSRFRRRYGMAVGVLLLLALLSVASRFVLVVEVEGNTTVPSSAILAQLQQHGFGVGSYGPNVDVRDLSNRVLLNMEELSFLTVNITGIRAQVIVRETEPAPEILDRSRATDIVADRDGVIVDVDAVSGRPVAEEGQAVLEGEVLISSMLINESGDGSGTVLSTKQIMAQGEVWALTTRTLSAATPLQALGRAEEGEEQQGYGMDFLGRRLNFYGNSSNLDIGCDKIAILYPITLPGGLELPFGLWRTTWQSWSQTPLTVQPDSARQYLEGLLERRLDRILDGGQVLSLQWQTEEREGAVTVILTAQCLEQIGRPVPLE